MCRRQWRIGKSKVNTACLQLLLLLLYRSIVKLIADAGIFLGKGNKIAAQEIVGTHVRHAEAQRTCGTPAEGLHTQADIIFRIAQLTRLLQKGFTCFRQFNVALAALHFEKLHAVVSFDSLHLCAERRLHNTQSLGRGAEITCFGNSDKVTVKCEIHSSISLNIKKYDYINQNKVFYLIIERE